MRFNDNLEEKTEENREKWGKEKEAQD